MLDFVLNLQEGPRFSLHRGLNWKPPILDAFYSKYIRSVMNLPAAGSIQVTTQAGRPDLLAYDIYADVQLWSILLVYNRKIDPFDIKERETIVYPSLTDLENLYFVLAAEQKQIMRQP